MPSELLPAVRIEPPPALCADAGAPLSQAAAALAARAQPAAAAQPAGLEAGRAVAPPTRVVQPHGPRGASWWPCATAHTAFLSIGPSQRESAETHRERSAFLPPPLPLASRQQRPRNLPLELQRLVEVAESAHAGAASAALAA